MDEDGFLQIRSKPSHRRVIFAENISVDIEHDIPMGVFIQWSTREDDLEYSHIKVFDRIMYQKSDDS